MGNCRMNMAKVRSYAFRRQVERLKATLQTEIVTFVLSFVPAVLEIL